MSSLLAMTLLLAASGGPADAPSTWIAPDPGTLQKVFGLRYTRSYAEFELLKTNAEEWTVPLLSKDGARLYVATRTGVLEALDVWTGESLWKRDDLGTVGWSMQEYRGWVILGSDSNLVAVDQQLGRERWKLDLDGKVGAEIVVTGTVALVPLRPNTVVAVDLVSQKVLWRVKRPTPDGITVRGQGIPTVDAARKRAYIGFSDGALLAVDMTTGGTTWVAALGRRREFFADVDVQPLIVDGGKAIIVASYNAGLFKLDAETGSEIWKQPLTRMTGLTRVERGLLVATFGSGQVAGLYERNGKVRWRYKVGKGYPTGPVDLGNGQVAFGVSKGPLTILDVRTGRPLQLVTPGSGFSVPPTYRGSDLVALTNHGLVLVLRRGEGTGVSAR